MMANQYPQVNVELCVPMPARREGSARMSKKEFLEFDRDPAYASAGVSTVNRFQ
jgi:hypothetical protein